MPVSDKFSHSRQGVTQQVNAVRGQGRVQTAVSVHDSFVDIQVEDIVLRICQSLQSLIAGVTVALLIAPPGLSCEAATTRMLSR